jgi:site-specific DNA-methyltransferase (adenine-specific)
MNFILYNANCLDQLKALEDNSIDSIVTDPPYGLSFMGKKWDYDVPSVEIWAECLRVLKPGGHLLAFAGTRTQHRMAVRIEDAGFEIRDMIAWVYGSGFPKSLDVSKAIDKQAGAERERVSGPKSGGMAALNKGNAAHGYREAAYYDEGNMMLSNEPATEAAKQWQGWGTALKPALEPITVARKPLIGTVAENVLAHGTGGLNIDGCRVDGAPPSVPQPVFNSPTGRIYGMKTGEGRNGEMSQATGRWPANLIHDGSDEVVAGFPEAKSGGYPAEGLQRSHVSTYGKPNKTPPQRFTTSEGSAARFFYCAKASKADRNSGGVTSTHPTVKPTDLMRYLCRLVTPPGGVVLDPFMGSGSTGKAAMLEGFQFIGIELSKEYFEISKARIEAAVKPAESAESTTNDLFEDQK